MSGEKPLVTWGEIAKFLGVQDPRTAQKIIQKAGIPLIEAYKPRVAVFPSTLRIHMEGTKT